MYFARTHQFGSDLVCLFLSWTYCETSKLRISLNSQFSAQIRYRVNENTNLTLRPLGFLPVFQRTGPWQRSVWFPFYLLLLRWGLEIKNILFCFWIWYAQISSVTGWTKRNYMRSKVKPFYTLIEILWSNLTLEQNSSWIWLSAGTPMLVLSTLARIIDWFLSVLLES